MSQRNLGIWSILKKGFIYNLFQWGIGGNKVRRRYVEEFVRPRTNEVLLDIGCGPGTLVPYLPKTIHYYGMDISLEYIRHAKRRFGNKATFICSDINDDRFLKDLPKIDLVVALGLLHHLNDDEVAKLFVLAKKTMSAGGRFISLDNCYVKNQSRIAKFLIDNDRGLNVRTAEEYELLAKASFQSVKMTISHDMLRVPYTHIIMECS